MDRRLRDTGTVEETETGKLQDVSEPSARRRFPPTANRLGNIRSIRLRVACLQSFLTSPFPVYLPGRRAGLWAAAGPFSSVCRNPDQLARCAHLRECSPQAGLLAAGGNPRQLRSLEQSSTLSPGPSALFQFSGGGGTHPRIINKAAY